MLAYAQRDALKPGVLSAREIVTPRNAEVRRSGFSGWLRDVSCLLSPALCKRRKLLRKVLYDMLP